jgi:simple sugar transport system permease protein
MIVAILAAVGAWFYLFRTKPGYELRAVGLQPDAAEYGGVSVRGAWFRALTLSGAIAGLGGINYVLGYKHYYEDGFAGGSGFLGIAVALVGRNHPLGVVLAALFFRDALSGRSRDSRIRSKADGRSSSGHRDHRCCDVGS